MTSEYLTNMNSEELVELYVSIAVAQDDALRLDRIMHFNKLFDVRHAIHDELRSRPGDQRKMLLPLLDHENLTVRRNAIHDAFIFDPDSSRKALEVIVAIQDFDHSPRASMTLDNLDSGFWVPE